MPELRKLNNFLSAFLPQIRDGLITTNLAGKMQAISPATGQILGIHPAQFTGKHISSLFHIKQLNIQEELVVLIRRHSITRFISYEDGNGNQKNLKTLLSLLYNKYQEPMGVLLIFNDAAHLDYIESDLIKNQLPILKALDFHKNEMFLVYDLYEQRYIYCSESVEKILGWTAEEYIIGGMGLNLCTCDIQKFIDGIEKYKEEIDLRNREKEVHDQIPIVIEYRLRHKNGAWKWLKTEILVLKRNEQDMVRYTISFTSDITQSKLKEDAKVEELMDEFLKGGLDELLINSSGNPEAQVTSELLSPREKEILTFIKEGLSTKEISARLQLTVNTINTYRKNLMTKLHARNSAELVRIALEQHIV